MIVECDFCKKDINKKPSQLRRSKNHFCSNKCHNEFRIKSSIEKFSDKLGEDFEAWLKDKYLKEKLPASMISTLIFGSKKNKTVVLEWLRYFKIEIRTGSEAIKTQWLNADDRRNEMRDQAKSRFMKKEVREKIKTKMQTEEYKEKQRLSKTGKNNGMYNVLGRDHPRWNEKRTHDVRVKERKTFKNSRWRKAVFDRDGYKCVICGDDKGGNLVAHHINSYDIFEEERYLLENGVTVCDTCHKDFHSKYGYGRNTKEQFNEFIEKHPV